MGFMKSAVEKLQADEQKGSGWLDRKIGEAHLVLDALREDERRFITALKKKRDAGDRYPTPGEAARVAELHRVKVQPAIASALDYETAAERAERAKDLQADGGARAPEANEDPNELQKRDSEIADLKAQLAKLQEEKQ